MGLQWFLVTAFTSQYRRCRLSPIPGFLFVFIAVFLLRLCPMPFKLARIPYLAFFPQIPGTAVRGAWRMKQRFSYGQTSPCVYSHPRRRRIPSGHSFGPKRHRRGNRRSKSKLDEPFSGKAIEIALTWKKRRNPKARSHKEPPVTAKGMISSVIFESN